MGTKTNWNEIPPRFRNIDRNIGYYRNSDFKYNYENNFLGKRAPHMNQLVEANNHLMPVQPNLQEYPLYITPVRNYPAPSSLPTTAIPKTTIKARSNEHDATPDVIKILKHDHRPNKRTNIQKVKNTKKNKKLRRGRKSKNSKQSCKVKLLYSNANGLRSKQNSLFEIIESKKILLQ